MPVVWIRSGPPTTRVGGNLQRRRSHSGTLRMRSCRLWWTKTCGPKHPQNQEDSQKHNADRQISSLSLLSQDAARLWMCVGSPNAAAARGDAAQAAFDRKLSNFRHTGLQSQTCAAKAFTVDPSSGQLGHHTLPSLERCSTRQTSHPAATANRCRRNRFITDGNTKSR